MPPKSKKSVDFSSTKDPYAQREAEKYEKPIPSRELILQLIEHTGKPLLRSEIAEAFSLTDEDQMEALRRRLRAMERDGQLLFNRGQTYCLVNNKDLIVGRIIGHADGFGFIRPDDGSDDLFLSPREMNPLMHNDRALVRVAGVDKKGRREGAVVEILERNTHHVVGRLYLEDGFTYVVPDNKNIAQTILIHKDGIGKAKQGQIVIAEIIEQPTKLRQPIGRIVEILGDHLAPGMEIEMAIRSYELPHRWPDELLEEIKSFTDEVPESAKENRVDLRDIPLVTIDGEDARDFDDAVYCKKTPKGWKLLVAIADVSHYVQIDSALDREARNRSTSVYFPEQVIPMLPEILSNGLCSLNPQVDRLCMVCELLIDPEGNVLRSRFFEGVMRSHARLTYTEVATMLVNGDIARDGVYAAGQPGAGAAIAGDGVSAANQPGAGAAIARDGVNAANQPGAGAAIARDGVNAANQSGTGAAIARDGVNAANQSGTGAAKALRKKYKDLLPHLVDLYSLYKVMRIQREQRGAMDFDTLETRIIFGKDRKIEKIVPVVRNDAHKLIEEFMITANMAAARYLNGKKMPKLLRIHEGPSTDKLLSLRTFLGELGLTLGGGIKPTPLDYMHLSNAIKGRPDAHLIQTVLLRSMSQAVYSPELKGHFGLALEEYAHFTSPIRRYPDLLVHRAIRHSLQGKKAESFFYGIPDMTLLGEHCSANERRADDATRDVVSWLKCEYMMDKVGEEFPGIISAVTSFGFFVELNEIYVEGLVHISNLGQDYFHFDPISHQLKGERTNTVFRLGDRVNVKVARVDLDEKKIDFELVKKLGAAKKNGSTNPFKKRRRKKG